MTLLVVVVNLVTLFLDHGVAPRLAEIPLYHLRHQLRETNLGTPTKLLARFGGIAEQGFHFRRAEIPRVHPNQRAARYRIDADLIDPLAPPLDLHVEQRPGGNDEVTDRELLARCDHKV